MDKEETLLDIAERNYNMAKALMNAEDDDEGFLCGIGFHLQQSIELAIKHFLEEEGIRYEFTNDITELISCASNNNVNIHISEYIVEHSEMLTSWESKTRYTKGFRIELRKIERAMIEVGNYLDICRKEFDKSLETEEDEKSTLLSVVRKLGGNK